MVAHQSLRSLDLQYYFGSALLYLAKEVAAPLSLSPENPCLLRASTVLKGGMQSHLAQPLATVRVFHHSKKFCHHLQRKVNFVELPKATLIFNYAVNVCLPPGGCYASSNCSALALNSLQIS